jgi:hypothetical protein
VGDRMSIVGECLARTAVTAQLSLGPITLLGLSTFWLVCFILSLLGGAVLGATWIVRLLRVEKNLVSLLQRKASADDIKAQIDLGERGAKQAGCLPAILIFAASAILSFHYFPWAPESAGGHIGRVFICLVLAAIPGFVLFGAIQSLGGDRLRKAVVLVEASDVPACREIVANWEPDREKDFGAQSGRTLPGTVH